MKTDREKLVELLKEANRVTLEKIETADELMETEDAWNLLADHLIANGVVVRESGAAAAVTKRLLDGEWVETQEVEAALGITFSEGLKLFDFGRTAEWNPAPLNGQKITTMFRLRKDGDNDG